MSDWAILRNHWAFVVSLGTVFGLVAVVVRAYRLAHGSSGYLLLLSGEHFFAAAVAVGLEALLIVTAALIFILVPMQFAYAYRETSAPMLLISATGGVVLIVAQVLGHEQLLTISLIAVAVAVVFEILLTLLFRRLDIRTAADSLRWIEDHNIHVMRRRRAKRRALKAKGHTVIRRRKKRDVPSLDSELGLQYRDAARRIVVVYSSVIAFAFVAWTLVDGLNPWIPIEQLTLTDGSATEGVMVVEEDGRWMTVMDATTGEFFQIESRLVDERAYCSYSVARGSIAIDC